MSKVIEVKDESIVFDDGLQIYSYHSSECCEEHYLSFKDLTIQDFEGLEFDLTGDNFFNRVKGYGIELIPLHGHPVRVPGYGSNNGYYSEQLSLCLDGIEGVDKCWDITDCQEIDY